MFLSVVVKPQDDGGVTEQLYAEIKPAVDGANYIIKHMRNKNDYNEVTTVTRPQTASGDRTFTPRRVLILSVSTGEGQLERDRPYRGPALPLPRHSGDDLRHHHHLPDGNLQLPSSSALQRRPTRLQGDERSSALTRKPVLFSTNI